MTYAASKSTSIFQYLHRPTSRRVFFTRMTSFGGFACVVFAAAAIGARFCLRSVRLALLLMKDARLGETDLVFGQCSVGHVGAGALKRIERAQLRLSGPSTVRKRRPIAFEPFPFDSSNLSLGHLISAGYDLVGFGYSNSAVLRLHQDQEDFAAAALGERLADVQLGHSDSLSLVEMDRSVVGRARQSAVSKPGSAR
jgi:hypothetical protein